MQITTHIESVGVWNISIVLHIRGERFNLIRCLYITTRPLGVRIEEVIIDPPETIVLAELPSADPA